MECAVLFADVAGSTALYEVLGDERAFALVESCLDVMGRASTAARGRVVKTIGDAVMAVFPDVDAATSASIAMQAEVGRLGPPVGVRLGVRVGFHYGPVVEHDTDVFGDTVNLASRLCDLASRGQIVTDVDTAGHLSPLYKTLVRRLCAVPVKGKEAEIELVEIMAQASDDGRTAIAVQPAAKSPARTRLDLSFEGKELTMGPERRKVTLGRDLEADFTLRGPLVSRAHATIERRREYFVLSDHSANGTYVSFEGQPEIRVHHEDLTLLGDGSIALGQPAAGSTQRVAFHCHDES